MKSIKHFFSCIFRFIAKLIYTIFGVAIMVGIVLVLWKINPQHIFKEEAEAMQEHNEQVIQQKMKENTIYDVEKVSNAHGKALAQAKYNSWLEQRKQQIQDMLNNAGKNIAYYNQDSNRQQNPLGTFGGLGVQNVDIVDTPTHILPPASGLGKDIRDGKNRTFRLDLPPPPVAKLAKSKPISEYKEEGIKQAIVNNNNVDEIAGIINQQ